MEKSELARSSPRVGEPRTRQEAIGEGAAGPDTRSMKGCGSDGVGSE